MNRNEIGKLIKTLREEVNIEIPELAEKIDLSERGLRDIESGYRAPGKKTLERIALVLGKKFNYFDSELLFSNDINKETLEKSNEVDKIITLSSGHISERTATYLNGKNRNELVVYDKEGFGWFIYLGSEDLEEHLSYIPEDLVKVIRYAQNYNCKWLCLDGGASYADKLPQYDW